MKILLLGEYSNVHATLALGLKARGHKVTVASNGDFWKNYPRDVDLSRAHGKLGGLRLLAKVYALLPQWRGFDIVQVINPMFIELKAERLFFIYRHLKRHNKRVILAGMGMDFYWVDACTIHKHLRYSDFNFGSTLRTDRDAIKEQRDWLGTAKEQLNRYIARTCDALVTGLYEYWASYRLYFPDKTSFIPLPIVPQQHFVPAFKANRKLHIFIGINKERSVYKGTDVMLRAALALQKHYADKVELEIAESVPFTQYQLLMNRSHVILDQLYSYTPAMNALLAMSKGMICVGGGEEENYLLLNEKTLRPIVNVQPNEESVYKALEGLVLHPERIPQLQRDSIAYAVKYHDYQKVAEQYEALYRSVLSY